MNESKIIIPKWHEVSTSGITAVENGNALIKVNFNENPRIIYEPKYYNKGIPGAVKDCYMREKVYQMLLKVLVLLPTGYGIKIYDAWRPFEVQRFLYDEWVHKLIAENDLDSETAEKRARQFVSAPGKDPQKPFVHATGGAIDLTIIDSDKKELDMGTSFDDFSSLAHTDSFENSDNEEVKNNRRLLYSVMTNAGFTNYPSEWWHYDYGDAFWASEKGLKTSHFGGIY